MDKKHGPWTIKGTALQYRDEFIEVNQDQVIRPDGEPGTYAIVRVVRGSVVLPVGADGTVYLTKQFRYAIGRESVEVVGGAIDEEESPLEAAKRELREELGITAEEWAGLGWVSMDTGIIDGPVEMFVARGLSFTEKNQDGTEDIKTVKKTLDEAIEMVMGGEIVHGVSCLLILKADRVLRGREKPGSG
jgi:8-oxo-dGTP pyrophosphatase MutT (NUDIX family)